MVSARPNRVKPRRTLEMNPAVENHRSIRAIAHAQFLSTREPRERDLATWGLPGPAVGAPPAVPSPGDAQFLERRALVVANPRHSRSPLLQRLPLGKANSMPNRAAPGSACVAGCSQSDGLGDAVKTGGVFAENAL